MKGKKAEAPPDLLTWTPSTRVDALAFEVIMIKTARVFFEAQPLPGPETPVSEHEAAIKAEFETYPVEEREAALDRSLTYTIGGVLVPLKDQLARERAGQSRAAVKEAFNA